MSNDKERSESYRKAHDAFRDMGTEEKASFLVESLVSTLVNGMQEATEAVSDAVAEAMRRAREECDAATAEAEAGDQDDGNETDAKDAE